MDSMALGTSARSIIAHALKYPITFFMELLRRLDTETKVLLREARLLHTFAPRAPDHCLSQDQKQLVVAARCDSNARTLGDLAMEETRVIITRRQTVPAGGFRAMDPPGFL
jgi:hypothetical protein